MEDTSRQDIRRLLKTFGVRADEALIAHLARNPQVASLRIRLVLEDLTDYGDAPSGEPPPGEPLRLEIEGDVQR